MGILRRYNASVAELFKGRDGKWYFHKRSPLGKITCPSQGYTNRRDARRACKRDLPDLEIIVKE